MIKILRDSDGDRIKDIANEWLKSLKVFLSKKLDEHHRVYIVKRKKRHYFTCRKDKYLTLLKSRFKKKEKKQIDAAVQIFNKYLSNIDNYVLADEVELEKLAKQSINHDVFGAIHDVFVKIYEDFADGNAYVFFKKLNIRTCPYCNRQYTFTIEKENDKSFSTRPEYDHFYDKSEHPLLALSFYNLVPSCHTCNHGKSANKACINPYFKGFDSKFIIENNHGKKMNLSQIKNIKNESDFEMGFERPSDDEIVNIETFGLKQLYNGHKDYVLDLVEKATQYDSVTRQQLIDCFQGTKTTEKDVYDFVWGRYLDDAEHEKRPLSKLTKDILDELGIIR